MTPGHTKVINLRNGYRVDIPGRAHFSRDFTLERKNDRLKTLESIRGGREEEKSLKVACDSVNPDRKIRALTPP
jgi:hypothetical protein